MPVLDFFGTDEMIDHTTGGSAISAGWAVVVGGRVKGIAHSDIPANSLGALRRRSGVYLAVRNPADTFTDMGLVYWDDTNKRVTTTAAGNTKLGLCQGAFAPGTTKIPVLFQPEAI